MLETNGNLWSLYAQVRVITTNGYVRKDGACVMGRGCAREAVLRYPGIEYRLGSYLTQHGNRSFRLLTDLASMPVKHNWYEPADLDLIIKSANELTAMADKFSWTKRILVPRPGCGNGQLSWDVVGPELHNIWDDRFVAVTF